MEDRGVIARNISEESIIDLEKEMLGDATHF